MEFGYKHGIATLMGDMAATLGRRVVFDKAKREIRPDTRLAQDVPAVTSGRGTR
ncbi:MAG: hypothetical protein HY718_10300 [Planctomycetes bacterium]|nr:hypothetical protein [Planctomycetota bacterium]